MDLSYVITGCACSATRWAAEVMGHLGSLCGHEAVFTPAGAATPNGLEGDSSWMAAPVPPAGVPVLLLVRDPLAVVRSLAGMTFLGGDRAYRYSRYAYRHAPSVGDGRDQFTRALRYVAQWDAPIAERSDVPVLRVEWAAPQRWARLYRHLTGRAPAIGSDDIAAVLERLGQRTNTHRRPWRRPPPVTWADIADHPDGRPVIDRALRYGYLEDPP